MRLRLALLKLRAMESRHYWRLRSQAQRSVTRITSARLASQSRASDWWALVRTGGSALARSLLLIAPPLLALALTQSVARLQVARAGEDGVLPDRVSRLIEWITSPAAETFDASELPSAAISVAGVFVAVYFATVTFVVSTTYKDATRKLRDQIVRQPESRWYVAFFTQAVVYVALALALPVLALEATNLTLFVAGLSAALVVLSFGRIWIALFVSLEPTSLFAPIQRDLNRWIQRAHKLGERENPSKAAVQRANQKIGDKLETLNDLVGLILDREHERVGNRDTAAGLDPRIGVAIQHLQLTWEMYSRQKHTIRTLPDWSPSRTQSKDWFLTSQSEVSTALATGTTLLGSEVVDDLWYERWIASLIERLLVGRELRAVEGALRGLQPLARALSARGQFDELRLWLSATTFAPMATVATYAVERGSIATPIDTGEEPRSQLSRAQHLALPREASAHNLVDSTLLEILSACLGYADYFARMRSQLPTISNTVTNSNERPIAGKTILQTITDVRDALAIETSLEGDRVTPDNALTQMVARGLAADSIDEVAQFGSYLEQELFPWVLEVGACQTWAAGAALSRATELTEKLSTMLHFAGLLLESCESVHIEHDDRWPDTDITELVKRAKALGDRLELPVATLATTVDSAPDSDRPDHFGWAYYRAHEIVLRRVLDAEPGDPEQLRQKVARLYLAGDVATQRLLRTVRRHDQSVINSYVAEPYVRFLQLSGIALVLAEVSRESAIFQPFESLWSGLLADTDRSTVLLGRAAATLSAESAVLGLTPGGIERSNIEIRANKALEDLGVSRGLFDLGGYGSGRKTPGSRPLSDDAARLLRRLSLSHFEGVFYARWLRPHAIAAGGTVPADVEQYLHLLELDDDDLDDEDQAEGEDDA